MRLVETGGRQWVRAGKRDKKHHQKLQTLAGQIYIYSYFKCNHIQLPELQQKKSEKQHKKISSKTMHLLPVGFSSTAESWPWNWSQFICLYITHKPGFCYPKHKSFSQHAFWNPANAMSGSTWNCQHDKIPNNPLNDVRMCSSAGKLRRSQLLTARQSGNMRLRQPMMKSRIDEGILRAFKSVTYPCEGEVATCKAILVTRAWGSRHREWPFDGGPICRGNSTGSMEKVVWNLQQGVPDCLSARIFGCKICKKCSRLTGRIDAEVQNSCIQNIPFWLNTSASRCKLDVNRSSKTSWCNSNVQCHDVLCRIRYSAWMWFEKLLCAVNSDVYKVETSTSIELHHTDKEEASLASGRKCLDDPTRVQSDVWEEEFKYTYVASSINSLSNWTGIGSLPVGIWIVWYCVRFLSISWFSPTFSSTIPNWMLPNSNVEISLPLGWVCGVLLAQGPGSDKIAQTKCHLRELNSDDDHTKSVTCHE